MSGPRPLLPLTGWMLGLAIAGCTVQQTQKGVGDVPVVSAAPSALAPLDFVRFCLDYAQECRTGSPNAVIALTSANRQVLAWVNDDVNRRIRSGKGSGRWRIDPPVGDCNDYVVTKRHELIRLGLPASALLMSVVKTPAGEGHLVLVARTDRGDLVLDNLEPEILPRERTALTWLKRQSAGDVRFWEAV